MPKLKTLISKRNSKNRSSKPRRKNASKTPGAIVPVNQALSIPEAIEKVLIQGDLSPLTPIERVDYYKRVCRSLGLNPLTSPFTYILFREGDNSPAKLQLYANKDCAAQLRKIHRVSVIPPLRREIRDDMCLVEVDLRDGHGKLDTATGVVALYKYKDNRRIPLTGREWANAIMKTETKAKRRGTLSICGLAFLDESELDTMEVLGGVTPEGRIYRYDDGTDPRQGSREAARRVLAEKLASGNPNPIEPEIVAPSQPESQDRPSKAKSGKLPESAYNKDNVPPATPQEPWKYNGIIEIDYSNEAWPIIRGDLQAALDQLKKACPTMDWGKDEFWHVQPRDLEALKQACVQLNYEIKELFPKPAPQPAKSASKEKTTAAEGPRLAKGIIERVISGMTGKNNPLRNVTMLLPDKRKPTFSCFDQALFEWLDKGNGKEAELYVQTRGKYTNIVGLKRCAGREFAEDGKTPAIQNKDREAGMKTLF